MDNSTTNGAKNQGIVQIHGKNYVTVAKRVDMAHNDGSKKLSIITEYIPTNNDSILFKATVETDKGTFTGYSAVSASTAKMIEKSNPYEVAETSAVGRALGFAGYGSVESIASADEMVKSNSQMSSSPRQNEEVKNELLCEICNQPAVEKKGITKGGKAYHGIFCSSEDKSHTRWIWN